MKNEISYIRENINKRDAIYNREIEQQWLRHTSNSKLKMAKKNAIAKQKNKMKEVNDVISKEK